jgi:hypothetical protein
MSLTNHRANKAPAPCCQCHRRIKATCAADEVAENKYGITTFYPRFYCREHCQHCQSDLKHARRILDAWGGWPTHKQRWAAGVLLRIGTAEDQQRLQERAA